MMGMNWAYAMSQGAAGMAGAGEQIADQQLKEEAEARASDRKLQDAERLLAIQEAMKNRASERFAAVARQKMGEDVPMEGKSLADTGITKDGATAAGLQDGIQGDAKTVGDIVTRAKTMLADPNSTDEQKQQAKEIIAQIGDEATAQQGVNDKAAAGKTRKRTWHEAIQAAREETSLTDAGAFRAGEEMFGADRKAEIEQKKLDAKEKIEDRKTEERNKEFTFRDAQQERRHEETMERLERMAKKADDTQNKQLQVQFAVAVRQQISDIDRDIREMEKNKKNFKFEDDKVKEINDDIAEKKEARKQLVSMQMDYFKGSGINVPIAPEPKTDAPKPGESAGAKNDPLGLRKK